MRVILLLLLLAVAAPAAEPSGSFGYFRSDLGVATGAGKLPDSFDAAPRWRAPLDSGHSTPVIAGNRVFLTTYNAAAQELATVALDATSGRQIWKRVAPAAKIEAFHRQFGSGAPCSPATDGERVYAFFGSFGLICYDLDGKKLWEHQMGPFQDEYGAGSSPVLIDDKVVLNEDHDIDNFIVAINRFTGKVVWKTPRPDAVRSYSTPVVWEHGGRKELLVAGALELASYDPASGR